ncbi:unnamed protein product [Thlaspi arvense]|uniref:F-box protein n=1 Tax=Thlaspi arvense TaxID=13288 RepID=A0AAU9S5Z1_THLAR|nr:unnamed protein product [Thlaspi arvense]
MTVIIPAKKEMIGSEEKICTESMNPMLVLDLVISVMEWLSFIDFHRARCVSSVWYSASRSCVGRTNPWLVRFPESNNSSCKLFDPSEHKSYTVRDISFGFARSRCLSNYGSWFLMLDDRTELYLLNLFTRERIPLLSPETMESTQIKVERISDSDLMFTTFYYKDNERLSSEKKNRIEVDIAVLWVDERSRDYLVVWSFSRLFAYHRKGDDNKSWKVFQPPKNQGWKVVRPLSMAFKESKLYVLSELQRIIVYDFSGSDSPMECASFSLPDFHRPIMYCHNLAVTLFGQVLIISSIGRNFLNFYTMDPESSKWSILKSLGEEALLMDQGITVAAKDGVLKNCIYYSNDQLYRRIGTSLNNDYNVICVCNIQTKKQFQVFPHLTASDARWFFSTFGAKWSL